LAVGVDEKTVDSHGRRRALEHGSTILALELAKERAAAEVERRLRGDLVEEVLAGGLEGDEAERIARTGGTPWTPAPTACLGDGAGAGR